MIQVDQVNTACTRMIPKGKLGEFQFRRLYRAIARRRNAGNRLAENLCDRAIVSLLAACDQAGVGEDARRALSVMMRDEG